MTYVVVSYLASSSKNGIGECCFFNHYHHLPIMLKTLCAELLSHILCDVYTLDPRSLTNCMLTSKQLLVAATPVYYRSVTCEIHNEDVVPFNHTLHMLHNNPFICHSIQSIHLTSKKLLPVCTNTLQLWINAEIVLRIIQLLPYLDTLKISKFTWTPFLTTNTPFSFAPNIYPQLYNSFFQHATLATIILESMDVTTVRPDVFHLASFTSQMVSFEAYKCYWHIISNVLPSPIPLRLKSLVLSSCSATTSFFYPNILLPSVTNLEKLHVNNLRWGDGSEDVTWFSDMLKSSSTSLKELKYTICSKQSMLLFYSV